MLSCKKISSLLTELFVRGRKINICHAFITLSYFKVPKDVGLNATHFSIMKILNKQELDQIALNNSSDIEFKDLMNLYKKYTAKPYSFSVIDATLASNNSLSFRKNLLEII